MWIHLGVLITAIVAATALKSDSAPILKELYAWMPLLAGVAVSIQPANRRVIASSLSVAAASVLMMVALDIGESYQDLSQPTDAYLVDGQVQEAGGLGVVVSGSWVRTAVQWSRGELPGISQRTPRFPASHPRLVALEALNELGLVLLCFAVTGIVLGVNAWLRTHARFDSAGNEAGARIAIAWLVSAAVIFISANAVADQRYHVMFGDAALWAVLTPYLGFLALGSIGFVLAGRSDQNEPVDRS